MASHHHPQQAAGGGDYNLDLANFDISDYMQTSGPPTMDQPTMFSGNSRPSNDSMNGATNAIQSSNPSQAAVGTGRSSSLSVAAAGNSVLDHHTNNPYSLPSSSDHHQIMFGGVDQQPSSQGMPPQGRPGQSGVNNVYPRGLVTTETLKLQLQQQLRLQQLQQLQNQILQQQIELISGQSQQQREMLMHGLLTPASSSELRPTTMQREYLSPMTLQAQQYSQTPDANAILSNMVSPAMTPQTTATTGPMSAPSAFQQSGHIAPMDMFSPLTSPALGPTIGAGPSTQRLYNQPEWSSSMSSLATSGGNGSTSPQRPEMTLPTEQAFLRTGSNKRPFGDDTLPSARKRLSPLVKATGGSNAMSQSGVGQQRKTRSRTARPSLTAAELSQATISTPSPIDVDMSMPPPPPPEGPEPDPSRSQYFTGNVDQPQHAEPNSLSSSSQPSPSIEPITPASMLNLGHSARMPTGLVHNVPLTGGPVSELPIGPITMRQAQLAEALSAPLGGTPESQAGDSAKKGKNVAAPKGKGVTTSRTQSAKQSPVIRPSGTTTPKTILPVGMSVEAASQLSQKSNYQSMLEAGRNTRAAPMASNNNSNAAGSSSPSSSQIVPEVKKNSHKGAEQKRRDALKAGFDELRLLLPAIVIDPDSDEPLLPGSAPPRGPQRNLPPGSEDHPNRGVSKLALLKCSNEYIGRLNKRVDRRDAEIALLRDELKWLRLKTGLGPGMGGEADEREWVDLEKDIDEVEREDPNLGLATITSGMKIKGSSNSVPESPNLDEANKKGKATKKAGGRAREKQTSMDIVEDDEDD
ncbi:hypothetical protein FRC00_008361 [Tulasnella sp. 408]|nr:hypothetical protein FRC00_008361 [Tulasnella sp. 408]